MTAFPEPAGPPRIQQVRVNGVFPQVTYTVVWAGPWLLTTEFGLVPLLRC